MHFGIYLTGFHNGSIITMEESNAKQSVSNAPEAVLVEHGIITGIGAT